MCGRTAGIGDQARTILVSVRNEQESITIKSSRKYLVFALIVLAIVVTDQYTKYLIGTELRLNSGIEVIPGFLNVVHVRNPGAAFGFLAQSKWDFRAIFFVCVSFLALGVILWLVVTSNAPDLFLMGGYSLFFSGTLGNLIDRLRFGEVVDFVDVHIGNVHWPAFNVADSALCVGAALFFVYFLRASRHD